MDADYNDKNKALLSQRAKDAAEAAVNAINGDYAEKARKKNKDAVTKTVDELEKIQPKIFSIWEIIMGRDVRPETLKNKLKALTDTYNTQMDELTSNFEEKKKTYGILWPTTLTLMTTPVPWLNRRLWRQGNRWRMPKLNTHKRVPRQGKNIWMTRLKPSTNTKPI